MWNLQKKKKNPTHANAAVTAALLTIPNLIASRYYTWCSRSLDFILTSTCTIKSLNMPADRIFYNIYCFTGHSTRISKNTLVSHMHMYQYKAIFASKMFLLMHTGLKRRRQKSFIIPLFYFYRFCAVLITIKEKFDILGKFSTNYSYIPLILLID